MGFKILNLLMLWQYFIHRIRPMVEEASDEGNVVRIQNRLVLAEHEMTIDEIMLRQSIEFSNQTALSSGELLKTIKVHTRAIDDRVYQVREVTSKGTEAHTTVNTTMQEEEVDKFESDWKELWKPEISLDQIDTEEMSEIQYKSMSA